MAGGFRKRSFCSPVVLLPFCVLLVYLFSLAGGAIVGGGQGEIVEVIPQLAEEEEVQGVEVPQGGKNRVKRSRDEQQLCGYRLLDALRSVCDRNFVGFSRRSDPGFLADNNGEGPSGEDIYFGNSGPLNPWDLALLTASSPSIVGGNDLLPPSPNRDSNSILDYLELQQPISLPPSPIFPWTSRTSGGVGNNSPLLGGRAPQSSKAFALKMLAESPKNHQRFRRNIIDECCKKPCAMGAMLKYCAITAGKRNF